MGRERKEKKDGGKNVVLDGITLAFIYFTLKEGTRNESLKFLKYSFKKCFYFLPLFILSVFSPKKPLAEFLFLSIFAIIISRVLSKGETNNNVLGSRHGGYYHCSPR